MKNRYKNSKRWRFKYVLLLSCSIQCMICFTSCEGFVEIDPPITDIVRENVFNNDNTATAAISGLYSDMFDKRTFISSLTRENGLYTDELNDLTGNSVFFANALLPDNGVVKGVWGQIYNFINAANAIIEGVEASADITPTVSDQLKGEALFIRAYGHFSLVNLWGDVPLVMSTDFRVNSLAPRDPVADVYEQIITDLMEARELLAEDYSFAGGERGRPNRAAASALLARVYLYKEDWANAEIQASNVINNGQYDLLDDLNGIFLINSAEAIWQLRSTSGESGTNTSDAEFFILEEGSPNILASLRAELINSFEGGDQRQTNWIGSFDDGSQILYYPFKYKVRAGGGSPPITEALTLFRLAEQYLIRAEARAQQNNISGAQEDLNRIRNRAGLGNTTAATREDLLLAIEQERKVELFTESSHRWFDLKRTGRAGAVLSVLKAGWQSTDILYPIPQQELDVNPNLTQNEGY